MTYLGTSLAGEPLWEARVLTLASSNRGRAKKKSLNHEVNLDTSPWFGAVWCPCSQVWSMAPRTKPMSGKPLFATGVIFT